MLHSDLKQIVVELLRKNEKLNAVKYVRDRLQIGLKQATHLVEALEYELFPERRKNSPLPLVAWIFAGSGVIFLAVTLLFIWQDLKVSSGSTTVPGVVTSLEYRSGGSCIPVIRYRYMGKEKYLRGSAWTTPPAFAIGENVELLISNRDENDVVINSFFERYFLIVFFSGFTLIFGGIGWFLVTRGQQLFAGDSLAPGGVARRRNW